MIVPARFLDHPGLEQMRADLKTDLFDAVYFHSADRIARAVVLPRWSGWM